MHPLFATHGAFDDVALVDLEVRAVNILAVMGSIAPIMVRFVHEFVVNGAIAPLDVIDPQSDAVAFEEITHSIPPTKLNVVDNVLDTSNEPIEVILVLTHQERIDGLHGLNKT
jgi:hypothetical protein